MIRLLEEVIEGKAELIGSCRKLAAFRHDLGLEQDSAFLPIVSIESESDHFILESMPQSQIYEYQSFIEDVSEDVMKNCRILLRKYSNCKSK